MAGQLDTSMEVIDSLMEPSKEFMTEVDNALTTLAIFSETKECPHDVRLATHQLARLITIK